MPGTKLFVPTSPYKAVKAAKAAGSKVAWNLSLKTLSLNVVGADIFIRCIFCANFVKIQIFTYKDQKLSFYSMFCALLLTMSHVLIIWTSYRSTLFCLGVQFWCYLWIFWWLYNTSGAIILKVCYRRCICIMYVYSCIVPHSDLT